ncbi:MAG TPA: Os1348 family NHLP clan protein [Methylomirabilota bacterium]|nr:Os1348 family NHLP clan protein [Methylomirabilota bacterium]
MSKEALTTVVQRSISDPAFRRQLATDATNALGAYDLTADEFSALRSRDAGRLTALGVELRMSKVFTIDQGALGRASIASAGVQSPDAIDRNLSFGDPASASTGVQSPDAIDRNLALDDVTTTSGAVQSPDAMDRNLSVMTGGSETPAVHTFSGDDNPGPEIHVADADLQQ